MLAQAREHPVHVADALRQQPEQAGLAGQPVEAGPLGQARGGQRQPSSQPGREDVEQHPPMTFKRFMAIFSLGCLLAAAQIPLYLIGGALGILLFGLA